MVFQGAGGRRQGRTNAPEARGDRRDSRPPTRPGMLAGMPPPSPTPAMPPALLCLCTCPDAACGERIAHALLQERLAACVSLLPGLQSVYRWQGALERASEVLLLIKTTPARYPALEARLRALHPYELPELLAFESSTGLPAYLRWLAAETGPQDPTT